MKVRWVAAALLAAPIAGAVAVVGDWWFERAARKRLTAAIDNRYSYTGWRAAHSFPETVS